MSRRGRLLIVCALLLLSGCRASAPAPTAAPTESPAAPTATPAPIAILTAAPASTPTPSPTDGGRMVDDLYVSPEISFVPLPTTAPTVFADGSTPTPSPPWTTPFPSPTGEATLSAPDTVTLAEVQRDSPVYRRADKRSDRVTTVHTGESYAVTGQAKGFLKLLVNGSTAYLPADRAVLSEANAAQDELLCYTLASWNVHNLGNGTQVEEAAALLKTIDADVVCVQEIDVGTKRANGQDLLRLLAEAADYPYYVFSKALSYQGGGYGTAILSKYPLVDAATIRLEVAEGREARVLGYARVLLNGGAAAVYNVHVDDGPMCLKSRNLCSLRYELAACGLTKYVLTGDFNCSPPRLHELLPTLYAVNIDKNTFGDGSVPKILDNILYTDGIVPAAVRIVETSDTGVSDHDLVYAVIQLRP